MTPYFIAVVMVIFMNGTVIKYNDGNYDHLPTMQACLHRTAELQNQLFAKYKDQKDPRPSSIIKMCIRHPLGPTQ